ncbi:winged helix-turn-helix domain-containing protein [Bacillus sp. CCB-MMP212]|uniref:winged helix-turn-helix domain-containing protein n=1 Tax=Bacillus sp. CCB-MMP212 TaxID=2928002 RepID=UPI001F603E68|nr:winged helix-turn-helix domain-containing protein [Bacillus sp. CCB-MMP212]MCI4247651.1 winged helix-turn-helix domain-containing protein [Bacillus sp. CCB-MMP212]
MDKTWTSYLEWRKENGYTGISTQEEYEEFLQEVIPTDNEEMSKQELTETEEFFKDVTVKDKVLVTFEAVKLVATLGGQITYDDLAQQTGYSLRTVKYHIKELAEKGYISVQRGEYTNSYFIGVNMANKNKPKKSIKFEEVMTFDNGCKDISGEVTHRDGINEKYMSFYNVGVLLDRTAEYLREVDPVGILRE